MASGVRGGQATQDSAVCLGTSATCQPQGRACSRPSRQGSAEARISHRTPENPTATCVRTTTIAKFGVLAVSAALEERLAYRRPLTDVRVRRQGECHSHHSSLYLCYSPPRPI